jgi:hypothetical protein
VVSAAAKREAVALLQSGFGMSERRACAVIGADLTTTTPSDRTPCSATPPRQPLPPRSRSNGLDAFSPLLRVRSRATTTAGLWFRLDERRGSRHLDEDAGRPTTKVGTAAGALGDRLPSRCKPIGRRPQLWS